MATKRAPGQVRDAILEFFRQHGGEVTVAEVCHAVSEKIGAVPQSSIRSYLRLNTPGTFRRVSRGRYRLVKGQ